MRSHFTFLASGFLTVMIGAAPAVATTPTTDVTMFPPVAGSCQPGQLNLLTWDGTSQVKCMQIPNCEQWTAGTNYPAPGYSFQTAQFLTIQNGVLTCEDPLQCPAGTAPQWNAQANKATCVNSP